MANPTTLQERLQILQWANAGLTDRQIARKTGRSMETVRKWRRRGTRCGREALASKMGRPRGGALCGFPEEIKECLLRWRRDNPGWGPKTLRAELEASSSSSSSSSCGSFAALPSRSSIARLLKEQGLTRSHEPRSPLPAAVARTAQAPHQLWEMDARGNERVPGLGTVALINLNDRYSRAKLLSYPCLLGRPQAHPTAEDYKTVLRLAFREWGLPEQLQVDHESVFFDNNTNSPYPTRLHLWLVALGVEVCFSRSGRPTDQAMTERSHQLWYGQLLEGKSFDRWEDLYRASLKRREFLNRKLPCASLSEKPPLVAFPEASHSGRLYRPELEAHLLDLKRLDALLEKGRWFRRVSKDRTISLGGQVYYLASARHQGRQLEITYDQATDSRHLLFRDEAGEAIGRKPIKGVSVEDLLGELEPYVRLPLFQPRLPFTLADEGVLRVCATMTAA
jgi:transposase/transposase InsO family protein